MHQDTLKAIQKEGVILIQVLGVDDDGNVIDAMTKFKIKGDKALDPRELPYAAADTALAFLQKLIKAEPPSQILTPAEKKIIVPGQ